MAETKNVCVWLDNQLMSSNDYFHVQEQLRTRIEDFQIFNSSDECIDFITDTKNAKIFFITSIFLGKFLVPLVLHAYEDIETIYLFHSNKLSDDLWTKDYSKIKRVFTDIRFISTQLLQDLTKQRRNQIGISLVSSTSIHSNDSNRQDPSFMYFQLLKDTLLNDYGEETESDAKSEMLAYCRQIYADNPNVLTLLDTFENSFIPDLSIYWYLKDSFLYRMLNKALYVPQPDVLYKLRYFLRQLHGQILREANTQRKPCSSMIVYRGQTMSMDEIENLQRNIGGLFSFHNFLSTSLEQKVALTYVLGSTEAVLFEMEIHSSIQKFLMVDIELLNKKEKRQVGQEKNSEEEILFDMGTVFRIVQIDKQEHFYHVRLTLSADIDEQLAHYTKRIRAEIRTSHSFLSLLKLMNELRQYNNADQFASIFHQDKYFSTNLSLLASIHHTFGSLYHFRGQYDQALVYLQKSLQIYMNYLPADHPTLFSIYNNLGSVYFAQSNYGKALEFQQLALDCQSMSANPDFSSMVTYMNNVATIYDCQGQYQKALDYHKRALDLQKRHLSKNDPSVIKTYNLNDYRQETGRYRQQAVGLSSQASADDLVRNGIACLSQGSHHQALDSFNRAMQIQQQYLLPNDRTLATTYKHIALTHYQLGHYEQALSYFQKALEIEQNSLSDDHPSIATSYYNISTAYVGLSSWSEALKYAHKSVEQLRKRFDMNLSTLAAFLHYIGCIYHQQDRYQEALISYEEALQIYQTLPVKDNLASVYHRTAGAYYRLERYNEALDLYQKTLSIQLKTIPGNAQTLAMTYTNLSTTYLALHRFDEAIITAEHALSQLIKTLPSNHPEVVEQRKYLEAIKRRQRSAK